MKQSSLDDSMGDLDLTGDEDGNSNNSVTVGDNNSVVDCTDDTSPASPAGICQRSRVYITMSKTRL